MDEVTHREHMIEMQTGCTARGGSEVWKPLNEPVACQFKLSY